MSSSSSSRQDDDAETERNKPVKIKPRSPSAAAPSVCACYEVNVINFSIGGGSSDPWQDLDAQAFLSAREAGIFVAASAGNSGPGASTLGSPADAPWVTAVGASTHNREFVNSLVAMTGGSTSPPADMAGKSVTSGYPLSPATAPIVYAGNPPYNSPLCGAGEALPDGQAVTNPFPPGTFNGEIVVCDRGLYGRVEKAQNVMEGGAGGFVLANDAPSGDSLIADAYPIPGVHITYDDGVTLKTWLGTGTGPVRSGRITGTTADTAPANGDVMASFSSRGSNPAALDLVKPDVTAPGVDILAAFNTPPTAPLGDPEYGIISGTSMSSPHTAGSAALIRALEPGWSPDEVKSALMSTSFTTPPGDGDPPLTEVHGVFKEDASTPADPFDMGGGRVNLHAAGRAGIVLDVDPSAYTAANPSAGGDPKTLNIASMGNSDCATSCSWTRTVKSTGPVSFPVTWTASVITPAGMTLTVSPASFILTSGGSQTLTVTANVGSLAPNQWHFATVVLTPNFASIPKAHFPVAVRPTTDGGGDPDVTVKRLTFHGNLHAADGCSGDGRADLVVCDGPFLRVDPDLDTNPAARWGPVTPALDGTAARNIYDPNWTWFLTEPTTVRGTMQVQFWASCGACTAGVLSADWSLRLRLRLRLRRHRHHHHRREGRRSSC